MVTQESKQIQNRENKIQEASNDRDKGKRKIYEPTRDFFYGITKIIF
jgi:hypothetical protein